MSFFVMGQSFPPQHFREPSSVDSFGVLDFFIEMSMASEVNSSGSLVGGAWRAMEGDDTT